MHGKFARTAMVAIAAVALTVTQVALADDASDKAYLTSPRVHKILKQAAEQTEPWRYETLSREEGAKVINRFVAAVEQQDPKAAQLIAKKLYAQLQAKSAKQEAVPAESARDNRTPSQVSHYAPEVAELLGAWSTSVPGAVWTSPSQIPGWDSLHVSSGALSGLLVIYPNGTYVWNAYGGKKGHWQPSGSDYPILLDDPAEHRKWKVGKDNKHPEKVYIVDSNGYFWYTGARP